MGTITGNVPSIVVTGAGGFMGSNLLPFLKNKGHFVRAVSRSFPRERLKLYNSADEIFMINLLDFNSTLRALEGMDYVIHLAADMGGVGYFHAHDYYPYTNNMTIDMNIMRACELLKIKRLYYASSACMYNTKLQMEEGNAPKLREDQDVYPSFPDQMYGWEKLMTTQLCERAPFEARVGIQHTVFGPYQEIQGERMKFPTAIATKTLQAKRDGKPIEIWGNGRQLRSYLYIEDAMEKIYEILTSDKYFGPVNVGSDEAYTVDEIARLCCEIVGISPQFIHTMDKPSGVLARNCDNTKFEKHYTYRNKFSTLVGFEELIKYIEATKNKI